MGLVVCVWGFWWDCSFRSCFTSFHKRAEKYHEQLEGSMFNEALGYTLWVWLLRQHEPLLN